MTVEIKGLTKRYGKVVAVDGLTLSIPDKSVYGLLGSNGAGKTTILGCCCGLVRPTSGDATVQGHSVVKEPDKVKRHIGLLTQRAAFYPYRTGLDHLVLYGKLSGLADARRRALEMMKTVGLEHKMDTHVRSYSNGMVKLLNLAQAFLADPEVVFLDEPIAGLDPKVAYKIKEIIKKEGKRRTIVLSSHYLEAMEKLCSHVAILDQGKLLASGPLRKVTKGKSLEKAFLKLL